MNKILCFLLLLFVSCKTNKNVLYRTMPSSNVLIYTKEKIVDYNFNDSRYKNKIATLIVKINKKEEIIQITSITYIDNEKPELNKNVIDSLFLKEEKKYFTIKGNKIKTKKYKTKYKRAWNDFATPGSSKTGGDKYSFKNDKLITQSRVEYILDKKLTIQENQE